MATSTFTPLFGQLAAHPRIDDLARLAADTLLGVASAPERGLRATAASLCEARSITPTDAETPIGNVVTALGRASDDPTAARLVAALAARAMAATPADGVDAEDQTAVNLVRVASSAGVDVMAALDEAAPDRASALWGAIADAVQRHDSQDGPLSRAEAVVAVGLMLSSTHPTARERRTELASTLRTPVLVRLLQSVLHAGGAEASLSGEMAPAPRGLVATFVLGLSGWLLVSHLWRLLARFALQYRRPVHLRVTTNGVVVKSTTKLLGRVLRETEVVIPIEGLARATREVRFPRAAMYAGLLALAIGSYFGVSWFVDGVRASSFSLVATGVVMMALGVALEFLLLSLSPGRAGKCRLVLVPRRGAVLCIGGIDIAQADAVLRALRTQQPS